MRKLRSNKKGFTLVELLMVVIIIGILVTIAVPNYFKAIERSKGAKGKNALDSLRKAAIQYRAINDDYPTQLSDVQHFDVAPELLDDTTGDGDWIYSFSSTDLASDITITATRTAGFKAGHTVSMTGDGVYTYDDATDPEWQ